jgi:hypothetical protein
VSEYNASRIKKPKHFRMKPLNPENSRERYVIGFDSEADTSSQGKPMLFQFSLPDTEEDDTLLYVVPEDVEHAGLRVFLDFLDTYCTEREYAYLIYVWNLAYELTQIFHDMPYDVRASEHAIITTDRHPWKIEMMNVKRQILRFTNSRISVTVLDGRAFYMTSLDKGAKMLGLGEKYASKSIDRSMFTRADLDDPEFIKYSKRDAYITRRIGEFIALQHDIWEIPTTVSAPHLAATVFKTKFLGGELMMPSPDLEQAGLYSYHGGKNGFYLDGPQDFPDIWQYDITSAYPEAMRFLPDIDKSRWKYVGEYRRGSHALYYVYGRHHRCLYRSVQSHAGSWLDGGSLDGVWITSYELDSILDHGELELEYVEGYEMTGPEGGALRDYVDHFFKIKQTAKGPERETAKLMLNSLYGKFFQKQPVGTVGMFDIDTADWVRTDENSDFDWEAGGLYHPPIASLITGFVRARIHNLEHKYQAVMTSTDGFFGFVPPDPADIGVDLGDLKAVRGRLRIWRERLYIFDGIDGERKYALHGFRGTVHELENLIPLQKGSYRYMGKQMITLKMANSSHGGEMFAPGTFVSLPYVINI